MKVAKAQVEKTPFSPTLKRLIGVLAREYDGKVREALEEEAASRFARPVRFDLASMMWLVPESTNGNGKQP